MTSPAALRHPPLRAAVAAGTFLALACAALVVTVPANAAAASAATQAEAPAPAPATGQAAEDEALRHARRLLRGTILIDGHNDLPIAVRNYPAAPGDVVAYDLRQRTAGDTDIPRLRAGGLGGQFWSVYIPGEGGGPYARMQLEQIELARRIIARYPDTFRLALTAADIRAAHRAGRIASMLGMEGGYGLENSLGPLRAYYELGVRYMTLTHNTHTDWADSAGQLPPRHGGLTPFGEEVVREMNRLGMLVDLAHTSADTMADALRVSEAPVIWSHASARGVCDVPRNVPDEILRELPRNGGVVMITFVAPYVNCEAAKITVPATMELALKARAAGSADERRRILTDGMKAIQLPPTPIGMVADHIEYVRRIAGVDHVGVGGDFDGNPWWPTGLSDVSMYPNLFAELIRRGWSDADLRKLAGENLLRAMAQAEKVAKRLQAERPASTLRFVAPPPAATTTSTPAQPPAPAPAVAPNGAPASPSR
ncbi:MAG: dipeptidase [Steroidobacteraceae bacterium]